MPAELDEPAQLDDVTEFDNVDEFDDVADEIEDGIEDNIDDPDGFVLPESIDPLPLPEELTGPAPRPIPPSVTAGPTFTRHRRRAFRSLIIAAVLIILAPLPATKLAAAYVLPLDYLFWIGLAVAAHAVSVWLGGGPTKWAIKAVRDGEVGTGQVLSLILKPSDPNNAQRAGFVYSAEYAIEDPRSGEIVVRRADSRVLSAAEKEAIGTRLRVGERTLVVWQPGQFVMTAKPYDFVEATDEHALIRNEDVRPIWLTLLNLIPLSVAFGLLVWSAWASGRYQTVGTESLSIWLPRAIGCVLGLVGCVAMFASIQRLKREQVAANETAAASGEPVEVVIEPTPGVRCFLFVFLPIVAIVLGSSIGHSVAITLNAKLDESPGHVVPVRISERSVRTHRMVFREYSLRAVVPNDPVAIAEAAAAMQAAGCPNAMQCEGFPSVGSPLSRMATPDELDAFGDDYGVAIVRSGYFGWPWVESVQPAMTLAWEGGDLVGELDDYGSEYLVQVQNELYGEILEERDDDSQ